jgi:hypothetical protein
LPERDPPIKCTLQVALEDNLPVFNDALLALILGRCLQTARVFVAEIIDEFIPGLDVVHA